MTEFLFQFLITLGIILAFFALLFLSSNIKASEERGKLPLYTVRCGVRTDWFVATYPYARVSFYEDLMVISFFLIKIVIFYSKIEEIKTAKRFFWHEIRILYEANLYKDKANLMFYRRKNLEKVKTFLDGQLERGKMNALTENVNI